MTSSTQNTTTNTNQSENATQTTTPAQAAAISAQLPTLANSFGLSQSTIPSLISEFTGVQGTGNSQAGAGLSDLTTGSNNLSNLTPGVLSSAKQYMAGMNPLAQTQAAMQGAEQEAKDVTMPSIASGAAATGNVNSTGTGVASGLVQDNLAQNFAQDYGNISSTDWSNALNLAGNTNLAAALGLTGAGNTAITSGTQTGERGATGVTTAPYASIEEYLQDLSNLNMGSTSTGSGTMTGTSDQNTTSTPSALSVIGGLLGAGGSMLGASPGAFGGGSGILGLMAACDMRFKTDIKHVGQLFDGTPVYTFRYKGQGPKTHLGVMAQEVEHVPEMVLHDAVGMKYVDYSKL